MKLALSWMLVALAVGSGALVIAAEMQPDIIGIYPGMPLRDAVKILQQHDAKADLTIASTTISQLGSTAVPTFLHLRDAAGLDVIQVWITLPPNEQVVWAAARRMQFAAGHEPTVPGTLSALRQKYGPESSLAGVRLTWYLDGHRTRLDGHVAEAKGCSGYTWGEGVSDYPFPTRRVEATSPLLGVHNSVEPCDDLTFVRALVNDQTPGLVNTLVVSFTDNALATRAKQATDAVIARGTATHQQKQQEEVEKRAIPKL